MKANPRLWFLSQVTSGHLASPSLSQLCVQPSSLFKLSPLTPLVPKPPSAKAPQTPHLSFPFPTFIQPSPLSTGPQSEGRSSQGLAFSGRQAALQAVMRPGKREVDVSMMGGRGSKKEEGPKGWVMGFLALLTSAPSCTDKGNSSGPHYTDSPHTELPAPFVPVGILGAGTEGHRREGGESTLEHLGGFQPQREGKIRLHTCPSQQATPASQNDSVISPHSRTGLMSGLHPPSTSQAQPECPGHPHLCLRRGARVRDPVVPRK